MFEKIRKMKNQKGFTLVELIVVLVILAILAAMLVPALTGYIDKANSEKIVATTRQVVMAAQTEVSEAYGKGTLKDTKVVISTVAGECKNPDTDTNITGDAIAKLAEVGEFKTDKYELKNGITKIDITYTAEGHVSQVVLEQGGKTCYYVETGAKPTTVPTGLVEKYSSGNYYVYGK